MARRGRRKVSNPLALAVLALLRERPMHPYEMGRTLRERHKQRSIKLNYGSLYMVVEQLTKAGFAVATETRRDASRPERTIYALTDEGRAELVDWMRQLISEPLKEYYAFEAGLALLPVLPPDEAVTLLRLRNAALQQQISEAEAGIEAAVAGGLDRVFLVEEDYRLALSRAEQAFVADLVDQIEHGPPGALEQWRRFHESPPQQ